MKRLALILAVLMAAPAYSVTVTRTKNGTGWVDVTAWNTGVAPVAGQDCAMAGYVITLVAGETTIPVGGGSLTSITSTGTAGQIVVPLATVGDCAISATTIQCGTAMGIVKITGSASGKTLTVTFATATGGTTTNANCIYNNCTFGTLLAIGNVNGSVANTNGHGILQDNGGNVSLTGNPTGGCTGGSITSHGIYFSSYGTLTVTGNPTGAGNVSYGVSTYYDITSAVLTGNLVNSATSVGWSGHPPTTWNSTTSTYITWVSSAGNTWGIVPAAGGLVSGTTCGGVVGTYTSPTAPHGLATYSWGVGGTSISGTYQSVATTDVRLNTAVGVSPAVGSLVVPAASGVLSTVTYDNGTAGLWVVPTTDKVLTAYQWGVNGTSATGIRTDALANKGVSGYQWGVNGTSVSGTRVDCPAASALTTQSYGDPGAQTTGTYQAVATTNVRYNTPVGVSPAVGSLVVPAAGNVTAGTTFDNGTAGLFVKPVAINFKGFVK